MSLFLIILSCFLWLCAIVALFRYSLIAPLLSFLGLLSISFAKEGGYNLLPINSVMITGWLCMTMVVMLATLMQPVVVRRESRGIGYMIVGAFTGLAVGLLGYSVTANLSMLYGIMIVAVVVGIFFGFLLYTRTPEGKALSIASGNFFRYILAKGFPVAITVMQIGIVLVLALALNIYAHT